VGKSELTKNEPTKDELKDIVKRTRKEGVAPVKVPEQSVPVSAGPIDRVIDLAFNPSRDKIREMTVIDRMQGRLLPQLDMVNMLFRYCVEIALYRQDPLAYAGQFGRPKPVPPDALDELVFRTAQWQKSIAGKNLERATDLALAEQEAKSGEGEDTFGQDAWKD